MKKQSAGLLLFRRSASGPQILLAHMGGPFWAKKDDGAWTIPKGEFTNEEPLNAAKREVKEEIGVTPSGHFIELKPVKQAGGKTVYAWAIECDCDVATVQSNTFSMEWPPKSGKFQTFPEIDRAAWFTLDEARLKILKGQLPLIDEFEELWETSNNEHPTSNAE